MNTLHPACRLIAFAALALGAVGAGAQTVSRTATLGGPAAQASAGSGITGFGTLSGAGSAGGSMPVGTGDTGRAIIVLSQPPSGTNVMGAAGTGPRGPMSAVDIASLFMQADMNRDGELSRAEAARLGLPMGFDELDTNHDGVISRFEFDEAFR